MKILLVPKYNTARRDISVVVENHLKKLQQEGVNQKIFSTQGRSTKLRYYFGLVKNVLLVVFFLIKNRINIGSPSKSLKYRFTTEQLAKHLHLVKSKYLIGDILEANKKNGIGL